MSSNKTTNYDLPQWEKDDFIQMDDFNAAFSKIDEKLKANADAAGSKAESSALTAEQTARANAIAALTKNLGTAGHNARIALGSYVGTGTAGAQNPTFASLSFYPVLFFITEVVNEGNRTNNPAVFLRPNTASTRVPNGTSDSSLVVRWANKGISWYAPDATKGIQQFNSKGDSYVWIAIGYDKEKEESTT